MKLYRIKIITNIYIMSIRLRICFVRKETAKQDEKLEDKQGFFFKDVRIRLERIRMIVRVYKL